MLCSAGTRRSARDARRDAGSAVRVVKDFERVPTLMLNGRYDSFFPVESSQKPFFQHLGTPAADKSTIDVEARQKS